MVDPGALALARRRLTAQLGSVAFGFSILVLMSGVWSYFSVSRAMQQHLGLVGRDLIFEVRAVASYGANGAGPADLDVSEHRGGLHRTYLYAARCMLSFGAALHSDLTGVSHTDVRQFTRCDARQDSAAALLAQRPLPTAAGQAIRRRLDGRGGRKRSNSPAAAFEVTARCINTFPDISALHCALSRQTLDSHQNTRLDHQLPQRALASRTARSARRRCAAAPARRRPR